LSVFAVLTLPWFIWTHWILKIPSSLVSDNLYGLADVFARTSWLNYVWIRVVNFFDLLAPIFLSVYPFNLTDILVRVFVCLPGAVGIILIWPALSEAFAVRNRALLWLGAILPATLLLAAFALRTIISAHGLQALIAVLIFLGLRKMDRTLRPTAFWSLFALQLLLNAALLWAWGYVVGIRFG
jgi:hypothetical protein